MNPEERLAEALHAALDAGRPSPDLAGRIVERVSASGRRSVRSSTRMLAGIAALVLVVALVPLAISLRSNGGPSIPAPSASAGSMTPTAPTGTLAHFDRDGLAFDYPASWTASVSGFNMHYITILDFLGTGTGLATCTAITPGPAEPSLEGTECGAYLHVGSEQVAVELSLQDGPPRGGPIDPTNPAGLGSGEKYVTVGGLPATFQDDMESGAGATVALNWTLSVPAQLNSTYAIQAEFKGPGAAEMRAQVEALVASIRYDPPVPVLNPADGPRFAASALAWALSTDPAFSCFPTVPGATATATVTQLPAYPALRKPLPVTCTTDIEPSAIGLWRLTLTESWTAASDRSAGSFTTTIWLDSNGAPGATVGGPAPAGIPYSQ